MDYHAVALEYMATLFQMRKRKNDKKINDSMHGEQFVLSFVSHRGGSVTVGLHRGSAPIQCSVLEEEVEC